MGVPSLYRWLTERYPEIRKKISKVSHIPVDNLYLDFNAIIHPCCNKELDTMEETDKQLYKNVSDYLDMVMQRMRPKKLLYISIDGVAPRAKLNQQRSRRFVSAKESKEAGMTYFRDVSADISCAASSKHSPERHSPERESAKKSKKSSSTDDFQTNNSTVVENIMEDLTEAVNIGINQVFDANAITPGTEFMVRLDKFLRDLIAYKISTDSLWSDISVIFSGYRVPGEGEQKILEYIRKHQNTKLTHVIYSPDADLIFLGLTLQDFTLYIMREEFKPAHHETGSLQNNSSQNNPYLNREVVLVDIYKLRSLLIYQFRGALQFNFSYRRFIEDWVFMCVAVGNDFLPCMPCFEIRANAIDKITSIMLQVFKRTKRHITDNGNIDLKCLSEFFIECARREDEFLTEKKRNLFTVRKRMHLPLREDEEFDLDSEKGKVRFYMEKMNILNEKKLQEACSEYIRGMVWVYKYYFYGVPSWDWFYPFHFAPFMADLACIQNLDVNFNLGRPLRPMEQLLAVLPPSSCDLLPKCLHEIFEKNPEFYPVEFKIDAFQKCMDWQAIPILPFIDIKKIVKGFNERQSLLDYQEAERNALAYSLLYSRDPSLIKQGDNLYSGMRAYEFMNGNEFVGKVYSVPNAYRVNDTVDSCGFKFVNRAICFSFDQRITKKAPPPKSVQRKPAESLSKQV